MFSSQNKSLASPRLLSSRSGISGFGRITDKKRHFPINNNSNIESRVRFRPGSELGPGKVPEDLDVRDCGAAEFFISLFLPKDKRLDMEMKMEGGERKGVRERERRRERVVRGRVEMEVERVAKERARPGERKKPKICLVESCSEVRFT